MNRVVPSWRSAAVASFVSLSLVCSAQQEKHGRGYKPPPPTAEVTVMVQKGFNSKPLPNASVIFRSTRDGKMNANLETKTDPQGRASLDLIEVGSHVTIQVIAGGFATYATDFDLTDSGKQLSVQLQRPREQVSQYGDGEDRNAAVKPGTQEHIVKKPQAPTSAPPPPASSTAPLQTTPPANTPAAPSTPPVAQQ